MVGCLEATCGSSRPSPTAAPIRRRRYIGPRRCPDPRRPGRASRTSRPGGPARPARKPPSTGPRNRPGPRGSPADSASATSCVHYTTKCLAGKHCVAAGIWGSAKSGRRWLTRSRRAHIMEPQRFTHSRIPCAAERRIDRRGAEDAESRRGWSDGSDGPTASASLPASRAVPLQHTAPRKHDERVSVL